MAKIPEKVDVVVAGSGAAGLTAAITLAEGGAKVIVFEKQRSLGGTSNFFQGTFAVESAMQRSKYVTYTRDEAFHALMEYSHWRANPRLVRAVVNESGATIAWLQQHGVVFSEVTINMPNAPLTYHVVQGRGEAAMKALILAARNLGVEMKSGTPVTRILKQGGAVTGVLVDDNGEEVQVATGAVVVATGGYANNREWLKKYTGYELDVDIVAVGNTDKMGDGIRMAWEAGAAEESISLLELYRTAPVAPEFAMGCELEQAAAQPDIWIDARGRRFCDETVTFYDSSVGNAGARIVKEGPSWNLMDSATVKRLMEEGIDKAVGLDFAPGDRLNNLEKEIKAAIDNGSKEIAAANSVEELAGKIGVEPGTLRATIEEYNRYCARGHDELFAKDRRYLRPYAGPVYYAVRARTVFLGTMGGIKINENAEVIDKKGNPIPGLYAGGFDAGGMYGDSYAITCASVLSSSFALNTGRIAGKHIIKYPGK